MTTVDLEALLEEIHSLKEEARGLERKNLQTLERVTEKLVTRQKLRQKKKHHPFWYFIIGNIFIFLGFLGFFDATFHEHIFGGLLWFGGTAIPSSWCVWKFLREQ